MSRDVRLALRALRKQPGLSLAAILTLAIGIGATTAIFGAADALLLRPLPFENPDRLVEITPRVASRSLQVPGFSEQQARDLGEAGHSLQAIAALRSASVDLATGNSNAISPAAFVSPNYFRVVGVQPALGRFFGPEEEGAGGAAAVVLSQELWRQRFGGDSGVVGRTVRVNWQPVVIIGVAPAGFHGTAAIDVAQLWAPLAAEPLLGGSGGRAAGESFDLHLIGRLRAGAPPSAAQGELSAQARHGEMVHPSSHKVLALTGVGVRRMSRLPLDVRGSVARFAELLTAVALMVLVIAAANVAGMLLVRGAARSREMAVRLALGASRRRIIRQLLVEGVLLSLAAAVVGVIIAAWLGTLPALLDWRLPVSTAFGIDGRVLAFSLLLSLVTGIGFSLWPALRASRTDIVTALKLGISAPRSGMRLRGVFVAGQIALSTFLLVAAGLFVHALRNALATAPGFDASGVAMAEVELTHSGYDASRGQLLYERLAQRVGSLPGVQVAALAAGPPMGEGPLLLALQVEGVASPAGVPGEFIWTNAVGPDYFRALRVPVIRGRSFTAADDEGAEPVAIVNEALAQRYWPGEDPIGKHFTEAGPPGAGTGRQPAPMVVVGVVPTGRYESASEEAAPYLFVPLAQRYTPQAELLVRGAGEPGALLPAVQRAVREVDPRIPELSFRLLPDVIEDRLLPQRVGSVMIGLFGLAGLLLAALGIYGVMAYTVVERRRELAVRMALGAEPGALVAGLLVRRLAVAGIGIAVGLGAAMGLTPLARHFLYGVAATDPPTVIGVCVLLVVVAAVAIYLPASRIARIDPTVALRAE